MYTILKVTEDSAVSRLGFHVLHEDILTCAQEELGTEPSTL